MVKTSSHANIHDINGAKFSVKNYKTSSFYTIRVWKCNVCGREYLEFGDGSIKSWSENNDHHHLLEFVVWGVYIELNERFGKKEWLGSD